MAKTGKGTGHQTKEGHQHIGEADERLTQSDLAIQGTNLLQGDDQSHVDNRKQEKV